MKIVLLINLVAFLWFGSAFADTQSQFIGVNDQNYLWMPQAEIENRMWSIQNAGIKWVRVTVYWDNVEGAKGKYYFGKLDQIIDEAKRKGLTVLPVIYTQGATQWWYAKPEVIANNPNVNCLNPLDPIGKALTNQALDNYRSQNCRPYYNGLYNYFLYQYLPVDPEDLVALMQKLVTHYRGRITYWELWNEPNWCVNNPTVSPCWSTPDADVYARQMKLVYPAIKQIDPTAKVLLGGFSYNDLDYLNDYYSETAGYQTFDILSLHPYTDKGAGVNIFSKFSLAAIRAKMLWAGDINKPIWLTEFGWPLSDSRDAWLSSFIGDVVALGYVEKIFYHNWSDATGFSDYPSSCHPGYGLITLKNDSDGNCTVETVTSALDIYADWAREANLVGFEFPQFNDLLNANSWYKFSGSFDDTHSYSPNQVRLVLDGIEITSYNVAFETVNGKKKWYFWLQPGPWLSSLGKASLPEHTVALKVISGGTGGMFKTSQSFRVLW